MSELFNASNREGDYCQTLLKLFDLHYSMGNFTKAADSLDRAVEIDAYEPGHQKRFEMLKGKIDESRYKVIASRLSSMSTSTAEPARNEPTLGAAALQDSCYKRKSWCNTECGRRRWNVSSVSRNFSA